MDPHSGGGIFAILLAWLLIPGAGLALLTRGVSWSKRSFVTHAMEAAYLIAPCLLAGLFGGSFFLDLLFFDGLSSNWDGIVAIPFRVWWGVAVALILEQAVYLVRQETRAA